MNRQSNLTTGLLLGLAILFSALANADDLLWPRLGRPAIAIPGGLLEVGAREKGALNIEREGQQIALETNWSPEGGTLHRGRAMLPQDLSPGRYDLKLTGASAATLNRGAIQIMDAIPEEYTIAILRGALSAEGGATLPADLGAQLDAASAQWALVLGPLTHGGSEEEYKALDEALLKIHVPVYLCPGPSDAISPGFQAHFGGPIFGATFGKDSYITLGAGLGAHDPQTTERLGEAHLLRRALRASRWCVGIADSYGLDWDMRAQIALFVDDPFNYLVAGSIPGGLGATVPWGRTAFVLPTEAPRGALMLFDVTARGIRPHQPPKAEAPPESPQEVAPGE